MQLPDWLRRRLASYTARVMDSRPPDFIIGPADDPYLERWHLTPRLPLLGGVYLHRMNHDDDDRALHDHPWPSLSLVLSGILRELYSPRGADPKDPKQHANRILAGRDIVWRGPNFAHRLQILSQTPAITFFIVGPRLWDWGFWCPQGWRDWRKYVNPKNPGEIGRGCD